MADQTRAEDFGPAVEAARHQLADALRALASVCEETDACRADRADIQALREGVAQATEVAGRSPGRTLQTVCALLDEQGTRIAVTVKLLRSQLGTRQKESRQRAADCARLQNVLRKIAGPEALLAAVRREADAHLHAVGDIAAAGVGRLASAGLPSARGGSRKARAALRAFRSADLAASFVEQTCAEMAAEISATLSSAFKAVQERTGEELEEMARRTAEAEVLTRSLFGAAWSGSAPPLLDPVIPDLTAMIVARARGTIRQADGRASLWTRIQVANSMSRDLLAAISGRCYLVSHEDLCGALRMAAREGVALVRQSVEQWHAQIWATGTGDFLRDWQASHSAFSSRARRAKRDASAGSEAATRMLQQVTDALEAVARVRDRAGFLCVGNQGTVPPLQAWALYRVSEITGASTRSDSEFRVVMLAAMKAGKSTLLNGLIGADVLPTRNVAMTCLPTRVVLTDGPAHSDPVLVIEDGLRRCLSSVTDLLRAAQPGEDATRWFDRHVHLARLLAAARSSAIRKIPGTTSGAGQVRVTLERLNDLIRLGFLLCPSEVRSMLDALEPPSVRVPFAGCGATPVVLIDTPGPDEVGVAEELGRLVDREVKRAHAAVLVLDFTRLETVSGIQAMRLVKDRPYLFSEGSAVVVNRIDQRRTGDRDPSAVRRFITHHSGRDDLNVLETSAHCAVVADTYLAADKARCHHAARDLLDVCYPVRDPEGAADLTPAQLKALAIRTFDRSGIQQVRRTVVEPVAADTLRKAAQSAVREAIVQLKDHQPKEKRRGEDVAALTDILAWSLQIAGDAAVLERQIAP